MFDLIWEVSEGAHWNGFFRRVLRISVALSFVRYHHLRICFGSQSARFQERFLVPNASLVDVKSCVDVVNCVNYEVQ